MKDSAPLLARLEEQRRRRLRFAFFYERPPESMPPYVRADWRALSQLGDTRWLRPAATTAWRRLLGPRGWLPSREVLGAISWCDVAVQWFATSPAPGLVARALGKPLVVIVGGYETAADKENAYGWLLDPRTRMLVKASLRMATVALAGSRFQFDEVRRIAPRARLSLLPLGADPNLFRPTGPRQARVITVGRVSSDWVVKGLHLFIRVARELAPIPFDIVGPLQAEAAVESLRTLAPPNVSLLGAVPHEALPEILGRCEVYLQLSQRETFCLALLEAMLTGCTPVVSDAGALPEVVGDAGHVVPSGDVSAAAAAIRAALDRPTGMAARKRAKELFPIELRTKGLSDLLLSLLSSPRSR